MYSNRSIHIGGKWQNIFETIVIVISFVIVTSVFAVVILSAVSSASERGKESNQAGLEGVQSSIKVKGSVIAKVSGKGVHEAIFSLALADGGSPINLSITAKEVVVGYKDATQFANDLPWAIKWLVSKQIPADDMLEEGELAEITIDLHGLNNDLRPNTTFNLEIKPPKGAVLNISRTIPANIQAVMDLN